MKVDPIRIILALSIWFLLTVAATGYYLWQWLNSPQAVTAELRSFDIKKGASLYAVAAKLQEQRLVRWPRVWVFYARLRHLDDIKAGGYLLAEKESPHSLLERFRRGNVAQYQITLVEGSSFNQFLGKIHSDERIQKILEGKTHQEIINELSLPVSNLEGWFFPDTYNYVVGDSDVNVLRRAYKTMLTTLNEEWALRQENLPYNSPYEALIMASIVEKETGVASERRDIAGVFVRRLQKKMRLQTDPTVIYGLGESYDGNLRRSDLKAPTPYNTYVIRGLPPTPIAMPGRLAIHAALNPAAGDYLYFVAKGDGTHKFSVTLEEHSQAVNQYQKKRRQDYRSSPEN